MCHKCAKLAAKSVPSLILKKVCNGLNLVAYTQLSTLDLVRIGKIEFYAYIEFTGRFPVSGFDKARCIK